MALYQRKPRHADSENMVIFQDKPVLESAENFGGRKPKTVLATSRAPLQECTTAVENTKIQLPRAAKQGIGSENFCQYFSKDAGVRRDGTAQTVQPQFTIYHDHLQPADSELSAPAHCAAATDPEEMELHPAVTAAFVPETFHVRSEIFNDKNSTGSSMVLDSPEENMCDDADIAVTSDQKKPADENYVCFAEYKADIYKHLREKEVKYSARPDYMRKQMDITHSMRSILVDWMVEVAEEYKLERETLCLAVTYVDRFLSVMAVARGKLQLVGAAAMFIAAKYEEIYPPEVGEFVYITDNTYTKKQVLQMERMILRTLAFDVSSPTANWFCLYLLKEMDAEEKACFLTLYLMELTMLDGERFLKYLPSTIAASCVYVSLHTLGFDISWDKLSAVPGYTPCSLTTCLNDLMTVFSEAPSSPHPAILEKYAKDKANALGPTNVIKALKEITALRWSHVLCLWYKLVSG